MTVSTCEGDFHTEVKVSRTLLAMLGSSPFVLLLFFLFYFTCLGSQWTLRPQILPFHSPVLGPKPHCPVPSPGHPLGLPEPRRQTRRTSPGAGSHAFSEAGSGKTEVTELRFNKASRCCPGDRPSHTDPPSLARLRASRPADCGVRGRSLHGERGAPHSCVFLRKGSMRQSGVAQANLVAFGSEGAVS